MQDQIAIVTGGSRGIGRAISLKLAEQGATVAACARNEAALNELRQEARERELPGVVEPYVVDINDRSAIDGLIEQVAAAHEHIDILVNNAGITRDSLLPAMDDDQFEDVLTTNLRSVFWLTRGVTKLMMRKRYGRIVNISSVSGVMGNKGQANYAASKAGLIGFSKSVAKELGKRKITCNVVAPGFIETDMTEGLPEPVKKAYLEHIPLARFGDVDEVARVVAFFAGADSAYVTGQVLLVDGGLHM